MSQLEEKPLNGTIVKDADPAQVEKVMEKVEEAKVEEVKTESKTEDELPSW